MDEIAMFQEEYPSNDSFWRSIILFGSNAASYKFALSKSLLDLAKEGKTHITAEELAIPYSRYICQHLSQADRQGTSSRSKFLESCRKFNSGIIKDDELIGQTVKLGFNNVLDAFHKVNGSDVSNRFFVKQTNSNTSGIILTDEMIQLSSLQSAGDLFCETEARWRLVETAWDLKIPASSLKIKYDENSELFLIEDSHIRRKNITPVRHALNGYQKGKCFYCFSDICVSSDTSNDCDVDHFIPHMLQPHTPVNLDGVWNLVLSCKKCNRGTGGKSALIPDIIYLERLNKRNNFLVNSHHPLRETIIAQTGSTDEARVQFLKSMDKFAVDHLLKRWHPEFELPAAF